MNKNKTYRLHFTFLVYYIAKDYGVYYTGASKEVIITEQPVYLTCIKSSNPQIKQIKVQTMNGRVYDPLLGRFLSPDNYVQMPDFSQNFNRYAYCFNNPLIIIDPSGEDGGIIAGICIFVAWLYMKNAHDNTPDRNQGNPGKWNWGFWNWGKDNTTVVFGYSTNFESHTFYGGVNGVGVGYNTEEGVGVGNVNNSNGFYYPGHEQQTSIDYSAVKLEQKWTSAEPFWPVEKDNYYSEEKMFNMLAEEYSKGINKEVLYYYTEKGFYLEDIEGYTMDRCCDIKYYEWNGYDDAYIYSKIRMKKGKPYLVKGETEAEIFYSLHFHPEYSKPVFSDNDVDISLHYQMRVVVKVWDYKYYIYEPVKTAIIKSNP